MFRAIPVIVAAMQMLQPKLEEPEAERIALALQKQARAYDFDPLTGVSIIFHESSFRPDAVSPSGEDLGLAQIRARYIGACKDDPDPVKNPSAPCRRVKRMLLQPEENVRVMAELIDRNRKFCKKKRGSALFQYWLASYQGRNDVKRKRWCVPGKGTWKVIQTRRRLIDSLRRRGMLR